MLSDKKENYGSAADVNIDTIKTINSITNLPIIHPNRNHNQHYFNSNQKKS